MRMQRRHDHIVGGQHAPFADATHHVAIKADHVGYHEGGVLHRDGANGQRIMRAERRLAAGCEPGEGQSCRRRDVHQGCSGADHRENTFLPRSQTAETSSRRCPSCQANCIRSAGAPTARRPRSLAMRPGFSVASLRPSLSVSPAI